jgi:hypothetical protein
VAATSNIKTPLGIKDKLYRLRGKQIAFCYYYSDNDIDGEKITLEKAAANF